MKINIALLGTGVIGTGVLKILKEKHETIKKRTGLDIVVKQVLYRSSKPGAELGIPESLLTRDYQTILNDPDIKVIVELIGGYEPAYQIIKSALRRGISVVSANKAIISRHLMAFNQMAEEYGANLEFEGAVAGSIPILNSVKTSFVADNIKSIRAILNGTSNYILSRMFEGMEFQEALALAQDKGFAEADPSFDLDGLDAAQKITILAMLLFNSSIDDRDIYTEGISQITRDDLEFAHDLGYIIKPIALARRVGEAVEAGVYPLLIPARSALAHILDENNAAHIKSDYIDEALLYGKGAGKLPTSSIVTSDIVRVGTRLKNRIIKPPISIFHQSPMSDPLEGRSKFYIRYGVRDEVGILAQIAKIMGDHNVSIAGVWQKKTTDGVVSLVMTTHEARVGDVFDSIKIIDASPELVSGKTLAIRIDDME